MVICGHFASEESRHAGKRGGVVIELDRGEKLENVLAIVTNFFPWKVRRKIETESRLHAIFVCFFNGCRDFLHKLLHESRLVGKEKASFCDSCLLDGRINSHARRVEACRCASCGRIFASIEARQIGRCKVDSKGGETELFALADFGVGSGEKFHGHKIPSGPSFASVFCIFSEKTFLEKMLDKKKNRKKT